jgi:hypothetical protein
MMAVLASLPPGIILHILLAPLSLAPSCAFVDDVLTLLIYSFLQVLGTVVGSVFSFVGDSLFVLVDIVVYLW